MGIYDLDTYLPNQPLRIAAATLPEHAVQYQQVAGLVQANAFYPLTVNTISGHNLNSDPTAIYSFNPSAALLAALKSGDRFVVNVFGISAANTNAKTITVATGIGADPAPSFTASGVTWDLIVEIMYAGAGAAVIKTILSYPASTAPVIATTKLASGATWSALAFIISLTGTTTSDITAQTWTLDFYPGPAV